MVTELLIIPQGQTLSQVLLFGSHSPINLMYGAPTPLPETVFIQVASQFGNFRDLQTGGVDITMNDNKSGGVVILVPFALQLRASTAVAADRVFELSWGLTQSFG